MSKRDEQIARIQGLMTYGISNAPKKTPITESIEGPDGKVYAIIREGSKFYIKSATKGSELVAESFNYIGGFMNKKNNEFSSYNQASKNLELKVRSLNEAYGVNKPVELLNPDKKETLMVEMTDAMKASLARYRQIMNNAAGIMNESATISTSNTGVPEAPKTTGFSPKLGEPFSDNAEAKLDKDLKATANDPEKQGEPFGDGEKAEEYKNAEYVPSGSVANQHPSGGKVVRVNENADYEETIEECDEWGSCGVPENGGVGEVGDDDPFTEIVSEDAPVGFADDDTAFTEGEDAEDVDIDLDDIDSSLEDEDGMEDTEIDDIDSEDVAEEPEMEDEVEGETDDIEALRQEIAELRSLVNELMGNEAEVEDEEGVEGEEDFADDSDAEFEGGYEDDDFEGDDFEDEDEPDFMKESVNLPFPVKVRYDELQDVRSRYGLAKVLKKMMAEMGGNENDAKAISMIHGKLMEILQCDYELRACMKNNHLEDDDWYEIIATMEANTTKIARLVNSLSFLDEAGRKLVDGRVAKLQFYINKYSEYYDAKINPDAQVEPEEEEIEEIPDVDPGEEIDEIPSEEEMHKKAEKAALRNGGRTGIDDIDASFGGLNMDDMYPESVRPRKLNEEGTKLNVFGKHPGYRKNLMSLPKTGNDDEGNVRDWNDDSVYSEEPFGSKIGSSAPYEDVINASVEAIMESLKKKR
jgi:hypothetical protein